MSVRTSGGATGILWVSKEVAGGPQQLDTRLRLELKGQFSELVQVLVRLSEGTAGRGYVPGRERGTLSAVTMYT